MINKYFWSFSDTKDLANKEKSLFYKVLSLSENTNSNNEF